METLIFCFFFYLSPPPVSPTIYTHNATINRQNRLNFCRFFIYFFQIEIMFNQMKRIASNQTNSNAMENEEGDRASERDKSIEIMYYYKMPCQNRRAKITNNLQSWSFSLAAVCYFYYCGAWFYLMMKIPIQNDKFSAIYSFWKLTTIIATATEKNK